MGSSTLKIVGLFIVFAVIVTFSTFTLLKSSGSSSSAVAGVSDSGSVTEEQVKEIVADYIQKNPEIILSSLTAYQMDAQRRQDEESQKNVVQNKDALERDPTSPVAGNPNGDVTLVQFFDYSCGYCKKVLPYVTELLNTDPALRVVFKEYPILGPNSVLASQAAVAVSMIAPEKYVDFHNALMGGRVNGQDSIMKVAAGMKIDTGELTTKMQTAEVQEILTKNRALADAIGVRGTPAFTINGEFIPGAIDLAAFKEKIAAARKGAGAAEAPAEAPVAN